MLHALFVLLTVTPLTGEPLGLLARELPAYHATAETPLELTRLEAELASRVQRLLRRSSGRAPHLDAALHRACRSAAEALAFGSPDISASEIVRASLEHEGVTDATRYPFTLLTRDGEAPLDDLTSLLGAHVLDRPVTHMGAGVSQEPLSDGERVITLVFVQRMVQLAPFQRESEPGERVVLDGAVLEGYGFPRMLVATPAGDVRGVPVHAGRRTAFWATVRYDAGPGVYMVEVLTGDRYGTQVASLFPVYVGISAPRLPVLRMLQHDPPGEGPRGLEDRVLQLLNAARREAGVSPLRRHAVLAVAARAHSTEMARWDYFGHQDPARGQVSARLARLGFRPSRVSEAISIAPSTVHAHADLLRSPSHRRVLLDPEMTHIGVGIVAVDRGPRRRLVITEELARLP